MLLYPNESELVALRSNFQCEKKRNDLSNGVSSFL